VVWRRWGWPRILVYGGLVVAALLPFAATAGWGLAGPLDGEGLFGAIRIYTAEPWEFKIEDVSFVQAVAQIAGMAIEMSRLFKGLKSSIEILKAARDTREMGAKRWTPHEGVPVSAGKMRYSTESST
jgi:GAF domain-containing protein